MRFKEVAKGDLDGETCKVSEPLNRCYTPPIHNNDNVAWHEVKRSKFKKYFSLLLIMIDFQFL